MPARYLLVTVIVCCFLAFGTSNDAAAQFVDPSFDVDLNTSNSSPGVPRVVTLQADGKMLVGGIETVNGSTAHPGIVRLFPNGQIDESFTARIDGAVGRDSSIFAIVVAPNGQILVAGRWTSVNGDTNQRYLVRLNADGTTDTAFQSLQSGVVSSNGVRGLALLPSGQMLISFDGRLRRLNASGSPDATFTPPVGVDGDVIVSQPDGGILVAEFGLQRLQPNGTLDGGFNATTAGAGFSSINALALRPDGRILAVGRSSNGTQTRVVQIGPTGTEDPAFTIVGNAGGRNENFLVLDPDGTAFVSTDATTLGGQSVRSLAKIALNGQVDGTFTPFVVDTAINVTGLDRQTDGRLVVVGHAGIPARRLGYRLYPTATFVSLAPGAPTLTSLSVTNPVSLSWQAGPGGAPTDYALQVGSAPGASDILVTSMGLSTSISASAPEGLALFVRVVATNTHGSAVSNEVVVVVNGVVPPGPPVLSGQTAANPVTLTWAPGPGGLPATYTLLAGTSSGGSDLGSFPMGTVTTVSAVAPQGLPIFVRVIAQNAAGSASSNQLAFVVPPVTLPTLTLQPPLVSGTTVSLGWNNIGTGVTYTLLARAAPGAPAFLSTPLSGAISLVAPSVPAGTYYVTVVGRLGAQTVTSNEVTVFVGGSR